MARKRTATLGTIWRAPDEFGEELALVLDELNSAGATQRRELRR